VGSLWVLVLVVGWWPHELVGVVENRDAAHGHITSMGDMT
jgi:hypothetical protein